jgi:hypothetical protein
MMEADLDGRPQSCAFPGRQGWTSPENDASLDDRLP